MASAAMECCQQLALANWEEPTAGRCSNRSASCSAATGQLATVQQTWSSRGRSITVMGTNRKKEQSTGGAG